MRLIFSVGSSSDCEMARYFRFLLLLTKILILFISCMIFFGCHSNHKSRQNNVARVGNVYISADDFRISYELSPAVKNEYGKDYFSKKKAHLQAMIDNKLLTIAGEDQHLNENFSKILVWYEKQAVIRELYREVVKDKVRISEEEIRKAFPLSNQRLMLRQLLYVSEDKAFEAYKRLQNGESFESLVKESARSNAELSYILTPREFKWGEIDERLESVAYNLEAMEVSSPVKIDQIYHLIQLVNRKESLLLTESSFQERSDYIEKTIRFREEAKLAESYAKTVLSDKHLEVNGPVLLKFTERLRSAKFDNDETGILSTSALARSERIFKDLLDKNLVYFTGGSWTLREFLDYIKYIPPGNRPNLSKPAQLKVDIALIIRDEFMAKEGYKRGLETCQTVKQELQQIREELLAIQMRHAITDTVKILEEEIRQYVQDCPDTKDEKYKKFALEQKKQETLEQFLSGLRKQYPVTIYDDILLLIKTTDELGTGRPLNLRRVRRF